MKKTFLIISMILLSLTTVKAQIKISGGEVAMEGNNSAIIYDSLEINKAFNELSKMKGAIYVNLSPITIDSYELECFRSITIKDDTAAYQFIVKSLEIDRKICKKVKEITSDGEIVSAYYQLPQIEEDINGFILFKNVKSSLGETTTLIYIKGDIDSDDLVSLLFTMKEIKI